MEHRAYPGRLDSGSAAAVAARMCFAALATQTGASTLRPAAYNGLVGFEEGPARPGQHAGHAQAQ